MNRHTKPTAEVTKLRSCWNRWTAIIELFARRRPGRSRVEPRSYAALHRELLATCRALGATADEATRAHCASMEDLAGPWLTPHVLDRADREILLDLMFRCRAIRRELSGRRLPEESGRWAGLLLLIAGIVAAGALLVWSADGILAPAVDRLDHWAAVARVALRRSSTTDRLGVLALVVVVSSIFVASRTSRS